MFDVRRITPAKTLPLRQSVLRPGQPVEQARFPSDDDSATAHFGAFRDGELLCIASIFPADFADPPSTPAYQLRGMATAPDARGSGLGTAIVQACIKFALENGAELLWCNARTGAVTFYEKAGFEIVGQEFHIPDVGPHFRM